MTSGGTPAPSTRFLRIALPVLILLCVGGLLSSQMNLEGPAAVDATSLQEDGAAPGARTEGGDPGIDDPARDQASRASSTGGSLRGFDVFTTVRDTVKRGDTLSGLLLRNRLAVQEIGRIRQLIREQDLFSPKHLRPGQTLELVRDDYGRFQNLRFTLSPEEIYAFRAVGDSIVAEQEEVDRHVRLRKLAGKVESSFDEAIRTAGGDYRLTLKVSDVLAYDVDFFTDVRRGDEFNLLVEERFVADQFVGYGEVVYAAYDGERAGCEAVHYSWGDDLGGHYTPEGNAMRKAFLRSPLNYRRISSTFGSRFHPVLKRMRHHSGVDYAADHGTPVEALGDGTVDYRGWKGGYGNTVRIRHRNGMQTLYGHLSRFAKNVQKGSKVSQGDVIGYVGQTGMATGPHLHFEVIERGRQINPMSLKNEPAEPIPSEELDRYLEWASRIRGLGEQLVTGQIVDPYTPGGQEPGLALVGSNGSSPARGASDFR